MNLAPDQRTGLDQLSRDAADVLKPWEEPYWREPPKGSPAVELVKLLQRELASTPKQPEAANGR